MPSHDPQLRQIRASAGSGKTYELTTSFLKHLSGAAEAGGGSFSGKDASKVDRSGAYLARYIAKNIVAADLADRCEVQLAYAIGLAEPVSFRLDTFGTERLKKDDIYNAVLRAVDMRPMAIMEKFGLMNPIFSRVSCYGHFGSNAADMPWERTDLQLSV